MWRTSQALPISTDWRLKIALIWLMPRHPKMSRAENQTTTTNSLTTSKPASTQAPRNSRESTKMLTSFSKDWEKIFISLRLSHSSRWLMIQHSLQQSIGQRIKIYNITSKSSMLSTSLIRWIPKCSSTLSIKNIKTTPSSRKICHKVLRAFRIREQWP